MNAEDQEICLVRTGIITRSGQPISFKVLAIPEQISESGVVTTLQEARRCIIESDRRDESLLHEADEKTLDEHLGSPAEHIKKYFSKLNGPPYLFWSGRNISVGPSTSWWKDGITDDRGELVAQPEAGYLMAV